MENNLHSAAGTDDIGRLWSLARGGGAADVDARDKAGDTPLHIAARVGNARAALLLLWLGADISVRTTLGGFTPLHLSLSNMHLLVSLIFIRAGALVRAYSSTHPIRAIPLDDVVDDEGRTPLQLLSLRLSRTAPPAMHREKREVYVWGECDIALGIPLPRAKYVVETPRRIDSISDAGVQSVVALQHSTGVITADGSVYTWGHGGRFGRLGHGCTAACPEPRLLSAVGPRVHMLAGGESHMLALCRDSGIVFSWGDNTYGQLGHSMAGLEADNQWLTPRQIDFFIDLRAKHRRSGKKVTITHIASGTVHSLCGVSISCGIAQRDIISEIYSWGSNERGQLGIKQVNLSRSHSHVPSKVKFPGEMQSNEGTSVQIIDLTAACYNSLVVLAHQKTRFGVFATSADSASMLENRNYATNDIYQFGNGVFSPFRINPLWSESCFSEESDNSICARCPDKYYTRVAVSVFTSLDLSAAIFLDGSVFLWSVPRASKNSKPTLELLPNQLVQLSRKRLGMGRIVTCLAFSQDSLLCSLSSGELATLSFQPFRETGYSDVALSFAGSAVVMRNFAGICNVSVVSERIFATVGVTIPELPHSNSVTAILAPPVEYDDNSSGSDNEQERGKISRANILSLQCICVRHLANQATLKNVGELVSVASVLNLDELMIFCVAFITRNFDTFLLYGNVSSIFGLLHNCEVEVESYLENNPLLTEYWNKGLSPEKEKSSIKGRSALQVSSNSRNVSKADISNRARLRKKSKDAKNENDTDVDVENNICISSGKISNSLPSEITTWTEIIAPQDKVSNDIACEKFSTHLIGREKIGSNELFKNRSLSAAKSVGYDQSEKEKNGKNSEATIGFSPLKLSDCFDITVVEKSHKKKQKSAPWSARNTSSPDSKPLNFVDIQRQDVAERMRSSNDAGVVVKTTSKRKNCWFLNSRPRAESLSDVMRLQEAQEKAREEELLEEIECRAAIEAVALFVASEEKISPLTALNIKRKQRTASL